nr:MAG TPA: hypothetical protein [Caudoviricetes sp.]
MLLEGITHLNIRIYALIGKTGAVRPFCPLKGLKMKRAIYCTGVC